MSQIKVMISRFYNGGAWQDSKTGTIFDPRKHAGTIFSFSPRMDLSGVADSIRKNHLVPFDSLTAIEFQRITRDLPVVTPQVVEVRGKHMQLEVVFDRPVYPRPGKYIHVPIGQGQTQAIPVVDAFMEGYATAVFAVHAVDKVRIEAEAFVDDDGVLMEAYGFEELGKPIVEEKAVEVKEEVIEVAEVEEAPKKKPVAKKSRKKAEVEAE